MKLLIVSDSHSMLQGIRDAVFLEKPDYLIHLGDHCGDAQEISREFPMLPVVAVRGNCDSFSQEQEIRFAEYGGFRILMTHGHIYNVKNSLLRLELAAREKEAHVVLFGHTHRAYCEQRDGLWMMNPGTCGYTGSASYGIIEIRDQAINCLIKLL